MARKYDSSRREEAARRTREQILDAAFRLHGLGIVDYESLAREANVSLATVRKHFPNRELLFEGCTTWGLHYAAEPDLETLREVADPEERLRLGVSQAYAFYESLFGQLWGTYVFERESEVMNRVLGELEGYIAQLADVIFEPWQEEAASPQEAKGFLNGLLSYLTYRALRRDGGLPPEVAAGRISEALLGYLSRNETGRRKGVANA